MRSRCVHGRAVPRTNVPAPCRAAAAWRCLLLRLPASCMQVVMDSSLGHGGMFLNARFRRRMLAALREFCRPHGGASSSGGGSGAGLQQQAAERPCSCCAPAAPPEPAADAAPAAGTAAGPTAIAAAAPEEAAVTAATPQRPSLQVLAQAAAAQHWLRRAGSQSPAGTPGRGLRRPAPGPQTPPQASPLVAAAAGPADLAGRVPAAGLVEGEAVAP